LVRHRPSEAPRGAIETDGRARSPSTQRSRGTSPAGGLHLVPSRASCPEARRLVGHLVGAGLRAHTPRHSRRKAPPSCSPSAVDAAILHAREAEPISSSIACASSSPSSPSSFCVTMSAIRPGVRSPSCTGLRSRLLLSSAPPPRRPQLTSFVLVLANDRRVHSRSRNPPCLAIDPCMPSLLGAFVLPPTIYLAVFLTLADRARAGLASRSTCMPGAVEPVHPVTGTSCSPR